MQKYPNSAFPSSIDDLIFFSDENLLTHDDMEIYRQYLLEEDYIGAKAYLNTIANADYYGADLFNMLEGRIYNLQNYELTKEKVSPYVYSATEPTMEEHQKVWIDINNNVPVVTSRGTFVPLESNVSLSSIIDFMVYVSPEKEKYGSTVLSSYPITQWNGIKINITGKNLFPQSSLTLGTTATSFDLKLPISPSRMYTISCTRSNMGTPTYVTASIGSMGYNRDATIYAGRTAGTLVLDDIHSNSISLRSPVDNMQLNNIQLEVGSSATTYEPYEGVSYSISFADIDVPVYGGYLNVLTGEFDVFKSYASYNGETLVGPWVSTIDDYVEGTTPTIGATVVDTGVTVKYNIAIPSITLPTISSRQIWTESGQVGLTYLSETE